MGNKISIVTINLNNAAGLERTITSVLQQTFSDFDFIVIDGGSTDESLAVIKKYERRISRWISEKDTGIYNAMNMGISLATGDYLQFLNSGDCLFENTTLQKIAMYLQGTDIVYGNMVTEQDGAHTEAFMPDRIDLKHMMKDTLWHPVSFIRRSLFENLGGYNERYKLCSDYDFFFNAIIHRKCSTLKVHQFIVIFDLSGVTSDIKNHPRIEAEKHEIRQSYLPASILAEYRREPQRTSFITRIFKRWFQ